MPRANEIPRFFAALDAEPNRDWRDYFMLVLLTGARKEDVLSMRWEALNLEEGVWSLPRTKNGDPQDVTLRGGPV